MPSENQREDGVENAKEEVDIEVDEKEKGNKEDH